MKQNFDISALRATAADIQGAVAPKSITADMVGGLFSALVEAQGEVIEALGALECEEVTVKIKGYDGTQRVSAAGAKVYVDIFSIGGVPTVALPRQELTANEEGVVTFKVFKGYRYAVFSKMDGFGASFQYVFLAGQNTRIIELYNMPIGVFMLGSLTYYNKDTSKYRCVPYISEGFDEIGGEHLLWDAAENEVLDKTSYLSVLISSAETSFAISENSRREDSLTWSGRSDYGHFIPTMKVLDPCVEDVDTLSELARADFNGNLNTAKILASCKEPIVAQLAAGFDEQHEGQIFLPSVGQLYLMHLNSTAINTLITAANNAGWEMATIDSKWYWSSTQANEFEVWRVNVDRGFIARARKLGKNFLRTITSFRFIYLY